MHGGDLSDTIIALATPQGVSALAVIRLSGSDAIAQVNKVFNGCDLSKQQSHTIHFGTIKEDNLEIDEVMVSVFIAPNSYTKENAIEISSHGSMFIVRRIIEVLIKQGARIAKAGEYTQRAFLNGRFDLPQAEAVADIILAETESARKAAMEQMRGGFSAEINRLREELVHFASMIELELDFGEEDVEFARRDELKVLVNNLLTQTGQLIESFRVGNVIKNGVPTVIAGKPNAGKSTLLNALLKDDRAIVSEIAGTTRDAIEDEIIMGGIVFRFIDTAGLRETTDAIEAMGVQRTMEKMEEASLILFMFDLSGETMEDITKTLSTLEQEGTPYLAIGNKSDLASSETITEFKQFENSIALSAVISQDLGVLEAAILAKVNITEFSTGDTVVTNLRHYEQLGHAHDALEQVIKGIDAGITNDFTAQDIRHALHYLGEITGQITSDDLLDNIFSKFCIGK